MTELQIAFDLSYSPIFVRLQSNFLLPVIDELLRQMQNGGFKCSYKVHGGAVLAANLDS